jgi:chemotaxis signal transduction protein
VAEAANVQAGLAVDEISDVAELPDPTEMSESDALLGAILHDGDLIGVLDVARLLSRLAEANR